LLILLFAHSSDGRQRRPSNALHPSCCSRRSARKTICPLLGRTPDHTGSLSEHVTERLMCWPFSLSGMAIINNPCGPLFTAVILALMDSACDALVTRSLLPFLFLFNCQREPLLIRAAHSILIIPHISKKVNRCWLYVGVAP